MDQSHFLLIPYSELGHLNPMLSLAARLAALGCKVTFATLDRKGQRCGPAADNQACKADYNRTVVADPSMAAATVPNPCETCDTKSQEAAKLQEKSVTQNNGVETVPVPRYLDNLRFVTLPDASSTTDPSAVLRYEVVKKKMDAVDEQKGLIVKIIEDAKATPNPISCVIHDSFHVRWVREVVTAYGLRSAVLSVCSALTFVALYLTTTGAGVKLEETCVSCFGMPSKMGFMEKGLISGRTTAEAQVQMAKYFATVFQGFEGAGPYLLNSFRELEAPLMPVIEGLGIDVKFIGPCLPPWNEDDSVQWRQMAQQAGSIYTEDDACLTWLDVQGKGSVLFVSFGSEGNLEKKQVEEIAMGIKESGYTFLWVVRSDGLCSDAPSQFFCEQAAGSTNAEIKAGMFVSWAPQRKVLQHPSIGGFLTHCGWNSVLESVNFGVRMLCLPLQADQPMNASFIHSYLQAGIQLNIREDGFIHREDVSHGVRAIMQGQSSERLSKFCQASQSALKKDADCELTTFVQAMII